MKMENGSVPKPKHFPSVFDRFQTLVTESWGAPFVAFDEGRAVVWEGYKERLRERALGLLRADAWAETDIGSGVIAQRAIQAIEIQETGDMVNNLVFWQNRFGHANRDHRILIECASEPKLCREVEALLFTLYRGDVADDRIAGAVAPLGFRSGGTARRPCLGRAGGACGVGGAVDGR
jgi:hypothetical protein